MIDPRCLQQSTDQIVPRHIELVFPPDRNVEIGQQFDFPALGDGVICSEYQIGQVWFG
jgi:hypothetical protein